MKNKKMTYLLIALVALIWGLVILRIFNFFKSPDTVKIQESEVFNEDTSGIETDTFTLIASYSDPFLGSSLVRTNIHNSNAKENNGNLNEQKGVTSSKDAVRWPGVAYGGIIQENSSSKKVALLSIANKNFLVREKQEYADLFINSITKDSIIIQYKNDKKSFKRNN